MGFFSSSSSSVTLAPKEEPRQAPSSSPKVPVIGILVFNAANNGRPGLHMYQTYHTYFQKFGKVRLVTPDEMPGERHYDLLVLPGGPDVSLALQQGDMFSSRAGGDNPAYTFFYTHRYKLWRDAGQKMFGICLGMQAMNLMEGGTIQQHVNHHSGTEHYIEVVHKEFEFLNPVYVNSRHHQAVMEHQLAPTLEIVAKAVYKADKKYYPTKLIEAVISKDGKLAAVQYHPEDMMFSEENPDYQGCQLADGLIHYLLEC